MLRRMSSSLVAVVLINLASVSIQFTFIPAFSVAQAQQSVAHEGKLSSDQSRLSSEHSGLDSLRLREPSLRLRGAGSSSELRKDELLDPTCPAMQAQAPEEFQIEFQTSAGLFKLTIYRQWSPKGADRIYNLVRLGFFDGARFYRVVPGWVVQFGVNGDPAINFVYNYLNDVPGAILPNEPVKASNIRGVLSFSCAVDASSMAVNRTSELYINLANNSRLDAMGFAPVGMIDEEGMKVVDALYSGYGEMQDVCRDRNVSSNPNRNSTCKGPWEARLYKEGNGYLESEFPLMDLTVSAAVVEDEATEAAGRFWGGWAAGVLLSMCGLLGVAVFKYRQVHGLQVFHVIQLFHGKVDSKSTEFQQLHPKN